MPHTRHAYKEVRLQQLRSFCETARLGSLTAAAAALGLTQPTIWEQVHALERVFGAKLIVPNVHGCRLTDAGRMLSKLAAPLVSGIDSLKDALEEARGRAETPLTIAATQRILAEDLPELLVDFERSYPQVLLRLLELRVEQICAAVESGEADVGLTTQTGIDSASPWLAFEPAYDLDLLLVTPKNHPLARRRRITPRDLLRFPLVNSPQGIPDPAIAASLEKLGVFKTQPRRVEAFYTAVIRRYVEMGFGVGLIVGLPSGLPRSNLHVRSMSRFLGRVTIYLVYRKGSMQLETVKHFANLLQTLREQSRTPRNR